jgi:uncharacterized membrane protein YeaQ/YmgE (transglycosylase-associated protein family)
MTIFLWDGGVRATLAERWIVFGMFAEVLLGVVGDFADHVVGAELEIDVAGISYGATRLVLSHCFYDS